MRETIITKVCIIGGGVAGMFAATTASFFKFDNVLIEKNPFLGGQVTQLYPSKYVYDFPTKIKDRSKAIVDELEEQMNSYQETTVFKSIGESPIIPYLFPFSSLTNELTTPSGVLPWVVFKLEETNLVL